MPFTHSDPISHDHEGVEPLTKVLNALRDDIVGELDAINVYQSHIDALKKLGAPEALKVAKLLEHIRDDEKEHVAEEMALLQELDAGQAVAMIKGSEDLKKIFGS